MPANRNALIRYKTIDNCLRNRHRKWALEDLIEACSEALYEYEGIDKGVSRRTVQMDIQMMRSEKLGYNAPITVIDRKYYTYENPDYTITNIPLTDRDLGKLTEVVDILKQFKGFMHFQELSGMVQKLEDKIHVSKTKERPIIDLEKNDNLKGLEHIDPIYKAILNKQYLTLRYQSFKARKAQEFLYHPAMLKEFRNRWFVLGKKKNTEGYLLLALDRIEEVQPGKQSSMEFDQEQLAGYFRNVVGVSVNQGESPVEVILQIGHQNAPYVLTKPIHHSQKLVEKNDSGIIISLQVQVNFELEREILGFGDDIKVIAPVKLKRRIQEKMTHALDLYRTELNDLDERKLPVLLEKKGSSNVSNIYTQREIMRIGRLLHEYNSEADEVIAVRHLMQELPQLKLLVFNKNLKRVLAQFGDDLFLTKAIYFNKPPHSDWYVTWHQDISINVLKKKETEGFTGWTKKGEYFGVRPTEDILKNTLTIRIHLDDTTEDNGALKILTGSHQKVLSDEEIRLITTNSVPRYCEVRTGTIHLMKPLLLHASSKTRNNRQRRVIHLEFNHSPLPNGLEWAERELVFN